MVRRYIPTVLILSFLLLLLVNSAYAAVGVDVTFTPSCDGYHTRGGSITADRDNTGRGFEALVTIARDGSGALIYQSTATYTVNQRFVLADGSFTNWMQAPQSNPIIMQIISPGGNGYTAQLVYTVTGNCLNLPLAENGTFTLDVLSYFPDSPEETTPFDPNDPLPRPVNPPGLAQEQAGYAIVSADDLLMRSGDGVRYTPVAILDRGTALLVLGSNGENWLYVEVGGIRGWVSSLQISRRGDLSSVPVVPVLGTLIPPTLYVRDGNPIFSIAAPSGDLLCQIEGGRAYRVIARDNPIARWFQIEAECDGQPLLGWIRAARGQLRNPANINIPIY